MLVLCSTNASRCWFGSRKHVRVVVILRALWYIARFLGLTAMYELFQEHLPPSQKGLTQCLFSA